MAWLVTGEDFLLFGTPALAGADNAALSGASSGRAGSGPELDQAKPSRCSAPCSLTCGARQFCHPDRGA
jgi:hypothetical protein